MIYFAVVDNWVETIKCQNCEEDVPIWTGTVLVIMDKAIKLRKKVN